ncbi:MAG: hypothetical protein NZZ41_07340, partial [Candidatus Dojkabacteria bacterium]|nr:hypothetical protein [Candidatus Dojkabacteria bacterium]
FYRSSVEWKLKQHSDLRIFPRTVFIGPLWSGNINVFSKSSNDFFSFYRSSVEWKQKYIIPVFFIPA